jgi:hypothetical protein
MFYKLQNDGTWSRGNKIYYPSGLVVDFDNKEEVIDGWFYSETEPVEYTDWKASLENNI